MNKSIKIDGREIGSSYPPYIIAEMSANHNGSIDQALEIIKKAKACGADALKLQTYTPDTLTEDSIKEDFKLTDGLWSGRTLYDLYKEAHTPWEWHRELLQAGNKINLTVFSSVFDETSVDFLEDLNWPAYKIASFEIIDIPLIKYVAKTGKPLIISTGMANDIEIQEAYEAAKSNGCKEIALLHCVSGYPAPAKEYNLETIRDMKVRFDAVIGLSDHTITNTTPIASIANGASIVEKHFTLDRKGGGPDDSFSIEPKELEDLCKGCNEAWLAMGEVNYKKKPSEANNIKFRRSLYFVRELKKGQVIKEEDIRSIRPGYGISPKYFDDIIGKNVSENIDKHTAVQWDLLETKD